MNLEHLRAFLWLRWRLRINQLKRGGTANAIILLILLVLLCILSLSLFVAAFVVGWFAFRDASADIVLYVWDGVIVVLLFCWTVGLLGELQRSEALSLDKFLHLPVSISGAFLINYLSSLLSLTLALFLPPMLGLSLGLVFSKGAAMLLQLPLLAALILMVTALTYQFQGWLASLMVNPRRRRTVIVTATMIFVLVCQLPNLLNVMQPWQGRQPDGQDWQQVARSVRLVNTILPPGWLALGAADAAEGNAVPALLGTVGLTLIGAASLWRSYRTTLRLYTGHFTSGGSRRAPPSRERERAVEPQPLAHARGSVGSALLEKRLPWVSEHASAIAAACFRSLVRAPEAKMILLGPMLMLVIFGSMLVVRGGAMPEEVRPFLILGAMTMVLLSMVQLIGNQFGFDRSGFRVFVLCPANRRDILLGKNLAVAPLALGLGLLAAVFVQVFLPVRPDRFLAVLFQLVTMYLLFTLLANCLSILAPMPMAATSLKPVNPKGIPLILHIFFPLLFPLFVVPLAALPLIAEMVAEALGGMRGVPINLIFSLIEVVLVAVLYHFVLIGQGHWLQASEQRILQRVATKAE